MKIKVKVKEITKGCKFEIIDKGDFIDLIAAEDCKFKAPQASTLKYRTKNDDRIGHRDVSFDYKLIKLGIAMQLPKGYYAAPVSRSSTFNKFGVIQANAVGVIDYLYRGNNDEWRYPAIALKETTIHKGDRICQFELRLSQKATVWQKLKWLFTSGYKFEWVDNFDGEDRGGFGTTGTN